MIHSFPFGDFTAQLMPSGAVFFAEEKLLCVADMHFEKGSYFARFGALLPPYDSAETLIKLERDITEMQPRCVLCLGDSFHDASAVQRMGTVLLARLNALIGALPEFIWVTGNHDPEIGEVVAGRRVTSYHAGNISFQHQADISDSGYEISGHYHPKMSVNLNGQIIRSPCFLHTGHKLILPAYGAYTGGLLITDKVFLPLLLPAYRTYILHRNEVFAIWGHG